MKQEVIVKMTIVYTFNGIIRLISIGVCIVVLLLIFFIARIVDKVDEWRKRREERIEKKLQEGADK